MKTIAQHVQQGIRTLAELQEAFQTAMQLEFATIPPYLCAQWSITADPSSVAPMIEDIVIQEMEHFALAGNILTAINGKPAVNNAAFVPHYPTHTLPGGIHIGLGVDLRPLSPRQLAVFMEIEKPEFRPVALALTARPATIGAFYDTIAAGLTAINPAINPAAPFVQISDSSGTPIPDPPDGQITSVAAALQAVDRIKREGEGTKGDPEQPPDDVTSGDQLAHYYVFKQIYEGQALQKDANGHWSFSGPAMQFPTVQDFTRSTANPDPSLAFNQIMTALLNELETCWVPGGASPDFARMGALRTAGLALIALKTTPEFAWSP